MDERRNKQPTSKILNKDKEILYIPYLAKYNDAFDDPKSAIFTENNG